MAQVNVPLMGNDRLVFPLSSRAAVSGQGCMGPFLGRGQCRDLFALTCDDTQTGRFDEP